MKRLLIIVLLLALECLAATHVAVMETIGASKALNRDERLVLTDELRRIAVTCLPAYMGYTIMTRENIIAMLPPNKSVEDCEGGCLVETGKNIAADYIAQARVGNFGKSVSVTVELYETASGKLVSSFIGRGRDAEDLLKEIQDKAPAMFSEIKGGQGFSGGSEGFSGFQEGGSFSMNANRQYLVRVNSKPEGAMLSVDGRPKCKSTPCNVQLVSGSHNFSFALDLYFDKDTSVDVQSNEQQISVSMLPNFGVLNLDPKLGVYGNASELDISVDESAQKAGNIRLSVGKHHVKIQHQCYESMSFDVSIKNGSELKFDRVMQPAMGGLSLAAEGENGPESVPVFIDGKQVGKTPYQETVPICAKIGVGNAGNFIPVKLKYHETVEFVYKGSSGGTVKDKDGNVYRTVKIGKQVWMAENLKLKTSDSWCYDDKVANCKKYGRLYTWKAALQACPSGWHLPSKTNFEMLFDAVGGESKAGKMLRSKTGWNFSRNNTDAYSFSALPAGYRLSNYSAEGSCANFWGSTKYGSRDAYSMFVENSDDDAYLSTYYKEFGFSVRCIKD